MPARFAVLLLAFLPACLIERRDLSVSPPDAPSFDTLADAPRFDTLADAGPEIDAALEVRVDALMEREDAPVPAPLDAWSFPDAGRDAPVEVVDAAMTTCSVVVTPNPVVRGVPATGMVTSNGSSCWLEIVGVTAGTVPCVGMRDFVFPDWVLARTYRVTLRVLAGPGGPESCGAEVVVE